MDPTRSSWLPLHSMLVGAAMRIAGDPRTAPFAVSLGATVIACVTLARSCRRAGLDALPVTLALVFAVSWRWSLFASASGGIPEMPCIALLTIALERWTSGSRGAWWQAGLALAIAAGFRYEAWFAIFGFAWVGWREPARRSDALRAGTLALAVPIGWMALNFVHRRDPIDFVWRVTRQRAATGVPLAALHLRWAELPQSLMREAWWIPPLLAVGVARGKGTATERTALGMGVAVLAGLALETFRGGGPTHHAARTLLPCVWLAVPMLAAGIEALALDKIRAAALLLVVVVAGGPPPMEGALPRDAARIGALVAGTAGPWCIEFARQDALWVEWRSGRPDEARPDRAYGAPTPLDAANLTVRCADATTAAASSPTFVAALTRNGFHVAARSGPWTMLMR